MLQASSGLLAETGASKSGPIFIEHPILETASGPFRAVQERGTGCCTTPRPMRPKKQLGYSQPGQRSTYVVNIELEQKPMASIASS